MQIIEDEELMNTDLYAMLQMVAPDNGIIIDKNIGLIGESEDEIYNYGKVATLNNIKYDEEKRGDYFQVIDSEGCILFTPFVKFAAPITTRVDNIGYCFFLKDYDEVDDFESAFGSDIPSEAVVIYYDNKFYAKRNYGNEFVNNLIIDNSIEIEEIVSGTYRLTFQGKSYVSVILSKVNNIYLFRQI